MESLLKVIEALIAQIQKVSVALQETVKQVNEVQLEAGKKIKEASDKAASNVTRSSELDAREAAVAKIENAVALEAQGREALKQVGKKENELIDAKANFESYRARELATIRKEQGKNSEKEMELEKAWATYNKREADLKVREANYKERVAESIVNNVKG